MYDLEVKLRNGDLIKINGIKSIKTRNPELAKINTITPDLFENLILYSGNAYIFISEIQIISILGEDISFLTFYKNY